MTDGPRDPAVSDDDFIRRFTLSQRALRAYIVGLTPSRADADDVLQEVNLALWRKRHLYDPQQEFLRWAFGFAIVEIRNFRGRSAKNRLWFSDSVLDSLAANWPAESLLDQQRSDAVAACLEKLGVREKSLITEFYGRGATVRELAERAGRPLSTVYKILDRARESLRECVQRTLAQANHPQT